MRERVFEAERYIGSAYVRPGLFTYQLAFGVSLRWFEHRPHLRLYAGPFKLSFGFLRAGGRVTDG